MTEKRKEHRLRASVPIKLILGLDEEIVGRTDNISRLGTYVEIAKEVLSGTVVRMVLELPAYSHDSDLIGEVSCTGTVFRCSAPREIEGRQVYGLGIFFTDFRQPSDRNKLSSFVEYLIDKEEQEIKDGLKRRKEKEAAHLEARHKDDAVSKHEAFEKEAMILLKDIASRLETITRMLNARNKK